MFLQNFLFKSPQVALPGFSKKFNLEIASSSLDWIS